MGKRRTYFRPPPSKQALGRIKPPSPARRLALAMLAQACGSNAQAMEATLDDARRRGEVSILDGALAQEIARGVCRQRRWLEQVLQRFLHHPLPRQAAKVHEALLIGIYQALFLDRIPRHTIVDETVRLVGVARTEASYRSLANAIMRRVVEHPRAELLPSDDESWLLRFSVPDWLASEAGQIYRNGDVRSYFEASNQSAPLVLRIVRQAGAPDPVALEESLRGEIIDHTNAVPEIGHGHYLDDCLVVRGRGISPDHLPSFRRGLLTVEDEGAQIAGWLTGAAPGMRILDYCASPGGKTAQMADMAGRQCARLVACDVTPEKLRRLEDTLGRLGLLDHVEVCANGELASREDVDPFDLVVVDAPCSALGTIRRHPEVRWRQDVAGIRNLTRTQSALLEEAARHVCPGGVLVYMVCTFSRRETDEVVDRFLADQAGNFALDGAPANLPFDEQIFLARPGRWRTATHRDGCDTFFVARLRRIV